MIHERVTTRVDDCFARLLAERKKGFIAYITAGDPSLRATVEMALRLEEVGVDLLELGIPFSDPLADGRVNQMSATRALAAGATVDGVFDTIARIRERSELPIICYSYLNPLCARGFEKTMRRAAGTGLDGLLLLDLPVEESADFAKTLAKHGLNNICLVTPTSPDERIRRIVRASTGFVYCVSREGVTGMQQQLASGATALLKRIMRHTSLPVALGFGVSNPSQARAAVAVADAVVVGSAIVDRFHTMPHTAAGRRKAAAWVRRLVKAVKEV